MSGSRTRPRLVRQLRLDGTVSLIELHGTGTRQRINLTVHATLFGATRAMILEARLHGSETIGLRWPGRRGSAPPDDEGAPPSSSRSIH